MPLPQSGSPKVQALACEVRTRMRTSPLPRTVRSETQGSGSATPGSPTHAATGTPFRNTWMVVWFSPARITDGSSRNSRRSGAAAEAAGAVMFTCWPKRPKPAGGVAVGVVSTMVIVPPLGEVTAVSIGSVGVAPSASESVEPVPPGDTGTETASSTQPAGGALFRLSCDESFCSSWPPNRAQYRFEAVPIVSVTAASPAKGRLERKPTSAPLQTAFTFVAFTRTDTHGSPADWEPLYLNPFDPAGFPNPFQP